MFCSIHFNSAGYKITVFFVKICQVAPTLVTCLYKKSTSLITPPADGLTVLIDTEILPNPHSSGLFQPVLSVPDNGIYVPAYGIYVPSAGI